MSWRAKPRSVLAASSSAIAIAIAGHALTACSHQPALGGAAGANQNTVAPQTGADASAAAAQKLADAAAPSPLAASPTGGGGSAAPGGAGGAAAKPSPMSTPPAGPAATDAAAPISMPVGTPVVYWLDLLGNQVLRAHADGSQMKVIASGSGISAPDGVAVDLEGGYIYFTNMGSALGGSNLATVQRTKLEGGTVETVVPVGVANTLKQMTIDHVHHKLYFCDREGAKLWRANMDGSQPEVLASDHGFNQLVGVALDVERAHVYFTDRNQKKILRAGLELPSGQTAGNRTDIEELFVFSGNAMPIDLDLDLKHRQIYWTDRMMGTVERAGMDLPAGQTASSRTDIEMLASGLPDTIGISLDLDTATLYFSQLGGQVWRADLDGSHRTPVATSGSASGVAFVRLPM